MDRIQPKFLPFQFLKEQLVLLDLPDLVDLLVQPDRPDRPDLVVLTVLMVQQVLLVLPDQRAQQPDSALLRQAQALLVLPLPALIHQKFLLLVFLKALLDRQDLPVLMGLTEQQVLPDLKGQQDQQGLPDRMGRMDQLDLVDQQDRQGRQPVLVHLLLRLDQ